MAVEIHYLESVCLNMQDHIGLREQGHTVEIDRMRLEIFERAL